MVLVEDKCRIFLRQSQVVSFVLLLHFIWVHQRQVNNIHKKSPIKLKEDDDLSKLCSQRCLWVFRENLEKIISVVCFLFSSESPCSTPHRNSWRLKLCSLQPWEALTSSQSRGFRTNYCGKAFSCTYGELTSQTLPLICCDINFFVVILVTSLSCCLTFESRTDTLFFLQMKSGTHLTTAASVR